MINTTTAMSSAMSVIASDHDIRLAITDFDMVRWTLSVRGFLSTKL
jgi:hypothetical protein